ncbi:hypothetical protein CRM22_008061 [Opisthorchis felineus]|uniref:Uncharacterized protein n=1 Tax=Opisthorchis felineus TaxID=147828 RepID=A0A4S2LDB9_OPIFE|nr:hypothetical protein CRM22_008061 [Opisthorchis felineus]
MANAYVLTWNTCQLGTWPSELFPERNFAIEMINHTPRTLGTTKPTGPYGPSPIILAEAADTMASPLWNIIRVELFIGQLPQDYMCSQIMPSFRTSVKPKQVQATHDT